jgi:hypothetical protein
MSRIVIVLLIYLRRKPIEEELQIVQQSLNTLEQFLMWPQCPATDLILQNF